MFSDYWADWKEAHDWKPYRETLPEGTKVIAAIDITNYMGDAVVADDIVILAPAGAIGVIKEPCDDDGMYLVEFGETQTVVYWDDEYAWGHDISVLEYPPPPVPEDAPVQMSLL